jgi:hypothetical protein
MRAVVFLSSDAPDTDVTVKLLDVFPDGRSMNMQEGITRVRYREGFDKPRMMTPGKVYEVPVDPARDVVVPAFGAPPAGADLELEFPAIRSQSQHRRQELRRNDVAQGEEFGAPRGVNASKLILPVVK